LELCESEVTSKSGSCNSSLIVIGCALHASERDSIGSGYYTIEKKSIGGNGDNTSTSDTQLAAVVTAEETAVHLEFLWEACSTESEGKGADFAFHIQWRLEWYTIGRGRARGSKRRYRS